MRLLGHNWNILLPWELKNPSICQILFKHIYLRIHVPLRHISSFYSSLLGRFCLTLLFSWTGTLRSDLVSGLKQSASSLLFSVSFTTMFSLPVSNTSSFTLPCLFLPSFILVCVFLQLVIVLSPSSLSSSVFPKKDEFLFPSGCESLHDFMFFPPHSSESFPVNPSLHQHVLLCRTKPAEKNERNIKVEPQQ